MKALVHLASIVHCVNARTQCRKLSPRASLALCRFYLSGKWNMGNWAVAFTVSALAIGAIQYHSLCGPRSMVTEVLVYVGLSCASYATIVCVGHFVRDVAVWKVFTAEKDLTPLQFMKLTHEGIRYARSSQLYLAVTRGPCQLTLHLPCYKSKRSKKSSATGIRTPVLRVKAAYPNQLDYSGLDVTELNRK
jgi:hypothetical protein